MNNDEWRAQAVREDLQHRRQQRDEHTRPEERAARDQLRHTQWLLLGLEPQYCGDDLVSPGLIAAVKAYR